MAVLTIPRFTYGEAIPRTAILLLEIDEFLETILDQVAEGGRIVALFGQPAERNFVRLMAVLAFAESSSVAVFSTTVADRYPSLTARLSASPLVRARNRRAMGCHSGRTPVAEADPLSPCLPPRARRMGP